MNTTPQTLHVAVGVIKNHQQQILIARRPEHVHQGGLWEFPGGKVEVGESTEQALRRELQEELAITVETCYPLGKVQHTYPDKTVLLDIYVVEHFTGAACGHEGQPVRWVEVSDLRQYSFPAANLQIIKMIELPERCLITGKFATEDEFISRLEASLQRGIQLIQLRLKDMDQTMQHSLARQASRLCQEYAAMLMLSLDLFADPELNAAGMHLTSQQLLACRQRPVGREQWLSASVHDLQQIQQANRVEADFIYLSPVQSTSSHPEATPMGWNQFRQLAAASMCPVFALGGMEESLISRAKAEGAHGIAAISALWGKAI